MVINVTGSVDGREGIYAFIKPAINRETGNSNALATELWSLGERCLALEKILRIDVCGLRWVAAGANP